MPDEPNSITTLKRFYGDRLAIPSNEDLIAELTGGNDRSTIITVASFADAAIEGLIAKNLPAVQTMDEKEFNFAFRYDGPIGPFSSRIDLAFYMGLIDEKLRDQLHDLRQLRNAVAHTKRRVTFDDPPLRNVARRLFSPRGMFTLKDNTSQGYRNTSIAEGNLIGAMVNFGRDEAVKMVRESYRKAGMEPPF